MTADARSVTPSSAGVRIRFSNATDQPVFLQYVSMATDAPWGGVEISGAHADLALQMPPGPATMRCSDGNGRITNDVAFEVLEGSTAFIPYYLECADGPLSLTPPVMRWADERAVDEDPLAAVREEVVGIRPSDDLDIAAYPDAPEPTVRLVRDDRVVAQFGLRPSGDSWDIFLSACEDADISLPGG